MRTPLAATTRAASRARAVVTQVLGEWGIDDALTHTSVLLVSELVTNAVKVTGVDVANPPPIGVQVRVTPGLLALDVWDSSPGRPSESHPEADAEGGRGLWLVSLCGGHWGVVTGAGGKVVYAELTAGVIPARTFEQSRVPELPEQVRAGKGDGAGQHREMHAALDAMLLTPPYARC